LPPATCPAKKLFAKTANLLKSQVLYELSFVYPTLFSPYPKGPPKGPLGAKPGLRAAPARRHDSRLWVRELSSQWDRGAQKPKNPKTQKPWLRFKGGREASLLHLCKAVNPGSLLPVGSKAPPHREASLPFPLNLFLVWPLAPKPLFIKRSLMNNSQSRSKASALGRGSAL
jgi:hypothetical protein